MSSNQASSSKIPSPSNFDAYLPHLTSLLDNLTTHAASLPPKSDLSFHKTLDRRFGKDLESTSSDILILTERLLGFVGSSTLGGKDIKGKGRATGGGKSRRKLLEEEDVIDGYRRGVVEVVDALLEDADSRLDDLNGQKKKAAIAIPDRILAKASEKLPGPFTKTEIRSLLPSHLKHDPSLPKPQIKFPDPVNNSTTLPPWKPTLTSKPHNLVPLDFIPPTEISDISDIEPTEDNHHYIAKRRMIKYKQRKHPYWYETRHLPYPTGMFTITTPIKPKSFEETPFIWVDTIEKLIELEEHLLEVKEIAVDLEHHDMRSYHGFTCLIQISTREGDWIVDALALRGEIRERKFGGTFVDPSIVKVFHGADSDIVWLQQDFDIYIVNLFDTYHATKVLNFPSHSLASLLSLYCDFTADKRYQMADWRIRPLPSDMQHYAQADTHFLLYIYDNLRNALLEKSSRPTSPSPNHLTVLDEGIRENSPRQNPQEAMRKTLSKSAETALKMYERLEYKSEDDYQIVARRWLPKSKIDQEAGWILKHLHNWRDNLARELDEGPFCIMPNETLKNLSLLEFPSINLVRGVLRGGGKKMEASERWEEIYGVIEGAKEDWKRHLAVEDAGKEKMPRKEGEKGIHTVFEAKSVGAVKANGKERSAVENGVASATGSTSTSSAKFAFDDLWSTPSAPITQTTQTTVKAKATSSLFGKAIKPNQKTTSQIPVVATNAAVTSSLFGKALTSRPKSTAAPKSKQPSPGFDSVLSAVQAELAPKPTATPLDTTPVEPKAALPEPETVPFIPAQNRQTIASNSSNGNPISVNGTSTTGVKPDVPKVPKKNEIVNVKRQKRRKRADTTGNNDGADGKKVKLASSGASSSSVASGTLSLTATAQNDLSETSTAGATNHQNGNITQNKLEKQVDKEEERPKAVKNKKPKIRAEDIPIFDYTNTPNLLDDPGRVEREKSGKDGKGKSKNQKKKEKKERAAPQSAMIETPKFGKSAPKDMSQPKIGNRSKTFGK